MAALFPGVDVSRGDELNLEEQEVGIVYRLWSCGLWNYTTLFANTFLKNGLEQANLLLHTGHVARPDLLISVPGWIANLLVIIGSGIVYVFNAEKRWTDLPKLLICFACTTGYFALIMALFQPRYLALFSQCLHPKLHI